MKISLILLLLFLSSCTTVDQDFRRRNVDEYFYSSGIVQYFLPDLPMWANNVANRQCQRDKNIRFFDFEKLYLSFGLNYQQMIQLQLAYNQEKQQLGTNGVVTLADEERLFYTVSERIQADVVPFKIPKFKRIHLVVVDEFIGKKETSPQLKKLLSLDSFAQGFPVFVSFCASEKSVRQLIESTRFSGQYEVLSAASFSPFDINRKLQTHVQLNVKEFFGAEKTVIIYDRANRELMDLIDAEQAKKY